MAYPCSSRSSLPRDRTGVSCIAADSLPTEISGRPIYIYNHCRRLYPLPSVSLITYLLAFSLLTFYSRAKPFEELDQYMSPHSCIHLRRFLGALRNSWKKQKGWWAPEIYWGSSKEDIHMASRHRKRCSASLIIKQRQMKTTMRYHLTPVRMATNKKSTNNKS